MLASQLPHLSNRRQGPIAFLLCMAVAFGCKKEASDLTPLAFPKKRTYVNKDFNPWVLTCDDPTQTEPAWLSNGLIGLRIGRDGNAWRDLKSRSSVMLFADHYETALEEKLLDNVASPLQGYWVVNGSPLDWSKVTDYKQVLDMQDGLLRTEWKSNNIQFGIDMIMHPERAVIGVRILIQCSKSDDVKLHRYVTTQPGINQGKLAIEGPKVVWNKIDRDRVQGTTVLGWDECYSLGASPISLSGFEPKTEAQLEPSPLPESFDSLMAESRKLRAKLWKTDIEIEGPPEDQQAIHSFLYYLRSSIGPRQQMGVSPFALSNSTYFGHIFWDADIWVFPALALIDPERAKVITNYRLTEAQKYKENYRFKHEGVGLIVPWESSVTGKETVPGPSQNQIHVTASAAFALRMAEALGLEEKQAVDNFIKAAAEYYKARSVPGKGGRELRDVMSPDEFHTGNNDLYTNILAEWVMREAGDKNATFKKPRQGNTFLTYDNDPLKPGYKQAAAVLAIYPLQYPQAEKEAEAMMARFSDKVTKNGPAMTDSIHALIWARMGKSDVAYKAWRASWQDFTQLPLLLFSEKRSKPVTYFTTGAAGCLQTVIFGFLGGRIDTRRDPNAQWSMPLKGGRWLSFRNNLPPAWRKVTLKNFEVEGQHYTLVAQSGSVRVTKQGESH